ncbi:MAG: nucleotide exchange factor GrpE [Candidatus Moranbacteria bacterium]|jgi:molecular chaperone GrpE|nr:nucleotide exchange factor GrpE [Candidatus Moranbacteria bacterium]MDX9855298.1 nucleotide exchange factor GrpE [Candidatus Moranbacteria bacterium]
MREKKEKLSKKNKGKKSTESLAQEYLDGWKRCQAEFDNYKKRQAESNKSVIRYATESIVLQILPVLDNFSSSVEHIPEDQKDNPWVTGIMHIKKQLEDVLRENGIEEIDIKMGDNFDTKFCEAIDKGDKEQAIGEKGGDGKVDKVVLKGYKIGDKIIRPARVIVK